MIISKKAICKTLEPFVNAKVYNPNNSEPSTTTRAINVNVRDLADLRQLYEFLKDSQSGA